MFKDFKEDPILMVPIIILIVAFIMLFSLCENSFCYHEFKREELTEQDYYNKFCTKHFDVSCDKIKIK